MKYLFLLFLSLPAFGQEPSAAEVISWKFKDAPGMSTKAGVITAFPEIAVDRDGNTRNSKSLPSAAELAAWTAEYKAANVQPSKTELQLAREEIEKLKAQMKEIAKTIPAVETVQAPAVLGAAAGTSK